jgi:hypothetical protein
VKDGCDAATAKVRDGAGIATGIERDATVVTMRTTTKTTTEPVRRSVRPAAGAHPLRPGGRGCR